MHFYRDQVRQEIKANNGKAAQMSAVFSHVKLYVPAHPAAMYQPQFIDHIIPTVIQ